MSTNAIPDTQLLPSEIPHPHVQQPAETSVIRGFLDNKFVKRFIISFVFDGSSVVHTFRLVLALWQVSGDYISYVLAKLLDFRA